MELTFKKVLDKDGAFKELEIWQGSQYITITFQGSEVDSLFHNWKWVNLRKILDKTQGEIRKAVYEDLGIKASKMANIWTADVEDARR